MGAITSRNLEVHKKICEALDLEPSNVAAVDISIHPDDTVKADVTLFIQEDQYEKICLIIKESEKVKVG